MTHQGRRVSLQLALTLMASLSCGRQVQPQQNQIPVSSTTEALVPLVQELHMLALGHRVSQDEVMQLIDRSHGSVEVIIDSLLSHPEASVYSPSVLFPWESGKLPTDLMAGWKVLIEEDDVYRVQGRPACKKDKAIAVIPWWEEKKEIRICPNSYRPEVSINQCDPNPAIYPHNTCGCGPKLIYCATDRARDGFMESAREELRDTVAANVKAEKHLARLFLDNTTIRNEKVEWLYRRLEVEAGAGLDRLQVGAWKKSMAPRTEIRPGFHAGLLTTPQVTGTLGPPREDMMVISEMLWCVTPASIAVDAERVFSLPVDFRLQVKGWQQLANTPVCDSCHARIDHGTQFFRDITVGFNFATETEPHESMDLYIYNRFDKRGTGPASPQGFAELAVKQPEFKQCMAQRVADHVFGKSSTDAFTGKLENVFASKGTYKSLMRTALGLYAAASPFKNEKNRAPDQPNCARNVDGTCLATPNTISSILDDTCSNCHETGGPGSKNWLYDPDQPISRAHALRVLEVVGSKRMPPNAAMLSRSQRSQFVHSLANYLWKDEKDRETIKNYHFGRLNNPSTHRFDASLRSIAHKINVPYNGNILRQFDLQYSYVGREKQELTPDFALSLLLGSVELCKEKFPDGELNAAQKRRKCVESIDTLEVLTPRR